MIKTTALLTLTLHLENDLMIHHSARAYTIVPMQIRVYLDFILKWMLDTADIVQGSHSQTKIGHCTVPGWNLSD